MKLIIPKWTICFIPITLITTTMVGLAAFDAEQSLQKWYTARYQQITGSVKTELIPYYEEVAKKLNVVIEKKIEHLKGVIAKTAADTEKEAKQRIHVHSQEYMNQLQKEKDRLLTGGVAKDFDQYALSKKKEINETLDQEIIDYLNSLGDSSQELKK